MMIFGVILDLKKRIHRLIEVVRSAPSLCHIFAI